MVEIYDRYGRLLYSVVSKTITNKCMAEDILQEVFLRIWNGIQTFNEQCGCFESWIIAIARNRAIDYLRSTRISHCETPTDNIRYFAEHTEPDRQYRKSLVSSALDSLTHPQREVLDLLYFQGLTQTEVAGTLNKPLGTVKSLARAALKNLRTHLAEGASLPLTLTYPKS